MMEMTEEKALSRLAALCSRGEHSAGEMDEKMRRWGLDEDARGRVVQYLVSHKYVDDERFARAFVRDKLEYNGWGRRKLEQALWQKRVAQDVIDRVLDDTAPEDFTEKLRPLLAAKRRTVKAKDSRELTAKLIRFAMGRGFSYEQIRECLDDADEVFT